MLQPFVRGLLLFPQQHMPWCALAAVHINRAGAVWLPASSSTRTVCPSVHSALRQAHSTSGSGSSYCRGGSMATAVATGGGGQAGSSKATTASLPPPNGHAEAKQRLRRDIKQRLKQLTADTMQQQSAAIAGHVLASPFFREACSLGLYITCQRLREVDTMLLLQHALQSADKRVFVPLVEDSASNMSMLHIDTLDDLQPAPPFGILEPQRRHPNGKERIEVLQAPYQLDLLLMPGLGFDATGARLGRGGGYYDKLAHNLDQRAARHGWHRPWLVALAFNEQLVQDHSDGAAAGGGGLPMDEHDRHVDVLATPQGLLLCSERARTHVGGSGGGVSGGGSSSGGGAT